MIPGNEMLSSSITQFREYKLLGEKTLEQLTDKELLRQPNPESNSIAIIIQHLHGNMLSRWTNFLTEDGEKEWRRRDEEFEPKPLTKAAVTALWEEGWAVFLATLESLTADDLLKTVTIRTKPLLVLDAINRQLAHYSYHVGQLVYLGRWMKGADWQSLSIQKGASASYNKKLKSE